MKKVTENKDEYKKSLKIYQSERETYDLVLPSGAVFQVVKLTMMEALEVFDHLPKSMEEIHENPDEIALNHMLTDNLQTIMDALFPDFVRTPVIVPSSDEGGELRTDELGIRDRWTILSEILSQASGGEGAKKVQAFQEPSSHKDGIKDSTVAE